MTKILLFVLVSAMLTSAAGLDTVRVRFADGKLAEIYTVGKGSQVKEGKSVSYHPNGKVGVEANYKNGKLDGDFKSFYQNGTPWQAVQYKDGVENGMSVAYFESGKKQLEEFYKNGDLEGTSKEWDSTGTLRREFEYKDGELNGVARIYDEEGVLTEDMEFVNGTRQGKYHQYKKGLMTMDAEFDHNRCIKGCP